MALCLTPNCVYEIEILSDKIICRVELPDTVNIIESEELKKRIHMGMEFALAPYFIGKF